MEMKREPMSEKTSNYLTIDVETMLEKLNLEEEEKALEEAEDAAINY
jgi:hypothetical protein